MRVLFLLLVLSAEVLAGEIKGAGAGSCGEWMEDRPSILHWLQGYISSYNHYVYKGNNPNGVFGDANHKSIAAWMDNYCQVNPLSSPADGVTVLIEELKLREVGVMPRSGTGLQNQLHNRIYNEY